MQKFNKTALTLDDGRIATLYDVSMSSTCGVSNANTQEQVIKKRRDIVQNAIIVKALGAGQTEDKQFDELRRTHKDIILQIRATLKQYSGCTMTNTIYGMDMTKIGPAIVLNRNTTNWQAYEPDIFGINEQ